MSADEPRYSRAEFEQVIGKQAGTYWRMVKDRMRGESIPAVPLPVNVIISREGHLVGDPEPYYQYLYEFLNHYAPLLLEALLDVLYAPERGAPPR